MICSAHRQLGLQLCEDIVLRLDVLASRQLALRLHAVPAIEDPTRGIILGVQASWVLLHLHGLLSILQREVVTQRRTQVGATRAAPVFQKPGLQQLLPSLMVDHNLRALESRPLRRRVLRRRTYKCPAYLSRLRLVIEILVECPVHDRSCI